MIEKSIQAFISFFFFLSLSFYFPFFREKNYAKMIILTFSDIVVLYRKAFNGF